MSAPRLSFFFEHSFALASSPSTFLPRNASRFCMLLTCCVATSRRKRAKDRQGLRHGAAGSGAKRLALTSFMPVTASVAFGAGAASFFLPKRWFIAAAASVG